MTRFTPQLVTHHTVSDTIREEERHQRRRAARLLCLWLANQPLVVIAFMVTMSVVTANLFSLAWVVPNGLPVMGALGSLMLALLALLQLFRLEPGYEVRDFLPRVFAKKFGW